VADPNPHIFDGTKWISLKGADGQPGPTVVSADAGNASRLGTDGRIYTPTVTPGITQADADARYVEVAGDTMTGALTVATKLSVDTTGGVGIAEIASLPVFLTGASGPVLTLENTAGRAAIRLGTSATEANNIFIDSVGDGRLALRTGNVGTIPEQLIAVIGKSNVGWNTDGFIISTTTGTPYCQFAPLASAVSTDAFSVTAIDGTNIAAFRKAGVGFRTDGFSVLTTAGTPFCQFGPLASAVSTDAFTVRDNAAMVRLNVSTSGSRVVGPEVDIIDDAGYRLATFKNRAFAIGTLDAVGDAAAAQIVVVGDDLGGVAASAASTLAQSNTRATVSIRPSPYSGFTLAIGAESTNNAPYIQGVNYAGGSAASPLSINPFGGVVGIGCIPTVGGVEAEIGGDLLIRGAVNLSGNITSTGTAHAFATGSIPSPAVIGNTPRTIAATDSAGFAGQMVWDDNFIYLRTTSGWKKVALTAI
jgi:hypothetical protein